jgi:peptide deformylase
MIRDVLKLGDVRLLSKAKPVDDVHDPSVKAAIVDMYDTLRAAKSFGLAAPQIGVDLRILVFGIAPNKYHPGEELPLTTLINPWIEMLTEETVEGPESCLSVPGMRGLVPRFTHIRYGGTLENGARLERTARNFHSRLFQHEYDHLDGILYPQRIRDMTKFGFSEALLPGNEWARHANE